MTVIFAVIGDDGILDTTMKVQRMMRRHGGDNDNGNIAIDDDGGDSVSSLSGKTTRDNTLLSQEKVVVVAVVASTVQLFLATAALCLCALINAFVLISVYPYAALMAVDLLPNHVTPQNAGPYSGLLASAFMFGRMLSAYPWGRLADVYGRRFVLVLSLSLSAIFNICFGLSKSFAIAIVMRFMLGITNGLVGTVKTVVSELAPSEDVESKMMGAVVGMRSWGFLISPAIGGWLAEPIRQHSSIIIDEDYSAWWNTLMSDYPFLLPNLVGATLCIGTAVLVWFCIPETLAIVRGDDTARGATEQSPLLLPSHFNNAGGKGGDDGKELMNDGQTTSEKTTRVFGIWQVRSVRCSLIPYWLFSLAVSALDEVFPLFCIAVSTSGGLGLSENSIGQVLSVAGLVFACSQYLVYVYTVDRMGLYKSLWIGSVMGFLPIFFIPLAVALQSPQTVTNNVPQLSLPAFLLLTVLMAVSKTFCCMFFASMSIVLNKTIDIEQRASVNGLATLGGSIFKGLGPILAGTLAAGCFSSPILGIYSSIVVFFSIGLMGLSVLGLLLNLNESK